MILRSEFAHIRIELDESGNGPRLMVRDERGQRTIFLDPLELASLAWCQHEDLAPLLDPDLHPADEEDEDEFDDVLKDLKLT